MSNSTPSSREVSGTLISGCCHEHQEGRHDHDEEIHVHVHLHHQCCPPVPRVPEVNYENFDGVPTELISAGVGSIQTPAMTITQVSGPGQCGVSSYSEVPDMLSGQALVLCNGKDEATPQLVRLDFAFACTDLKFAITYQHKPVTLWFYDKQGKLQGTRDLSPTEGLNKWVEFSAPPGEEISRMDISVSDWLYIDFFTFSRRPVPRSSCGKSSEQVHVHVHTHHCCESKPCVAETRSESKSCKDEKRYEKF